MTLPWFDFEYYNLTPFLFRYILFGNVFTLPVHSLAISYSWAIEQAMVLNRQRSTYKPFLLWYFSANVTKLRQNRASRPFKRSWEKQNIRINRELILSLILVLLAEVWLVCSSLTVYVEGLWWFTTKT